jgi:hypothetical protein
LYVEDFDERERHRCYKGCVCQNVFACTRFNYQFSFVLAGWEGRAHDGQVYNDAIDKGFCIVRGGGLYFLADSGYALSSYVLVPYRGVRYHLQEWAAADKAYVLQQCGHFVFFWSREIAVASIGALFATLNGK